MAEEKNDLSTQMLDRRVVSLFGEINDKMVDELLRNLLLLQLASSDPVYLVIDSGGGELYSALRLYDALEHMFTMEVSAVVLGECKSAATFVLLACKNRLATPHSRFMIHSGLVSGIKIKTDDLTAVKIQHLLAEINEETTALTELYRKKLAKEPEEIKALIARGDQDFNNGFFAQEALQIGLITAVVTGKLPFFPNKTE